ncbi:MAG TPA: hemolysin family protein [Tepidisphaeraceae bacterium]|jgi:CBS domain containing-hemolysin-like protein
MIFLCILLAATLSLFFSTLTYSLRDMSRARLDDELDRRGKSHYLESTVEHQNDLIFVTAFGRLLSNIMVLIAVMYLFHRLAYPLWLQYGLAVFITGGITLMVSVAVPHAAARHAAEPIIASFAGFLNLLGKVLLPATKLMNATDILVARAATGTAGPSDERIEQDIEQEILSVVEEGEKEGVVDEQERKMIERVIAFHDTQAGQIMTSRTDMFAIDVRATLEQVKEMIAASGHSRLPVYEGSLDHIVGVLYARDLLKLVGEPPEKFSVRGVMRPALFVPETKLLRDLLRDFTLQKVHIAIVSDEYGGTAGLVTIEDIFEELVGEISDEHEPEEPAMIKRISDSTIEADARVAIDELNRLLGLNLPEDAGYETLGGFVTTTAGKIPEVGSSFEYSGAKYVVLDAEPQKVNRVRIELAGQPVSEGTGS